MVVFTTTYTIATMYKRVRTLDLDSYADATGVSNPLPRMAVNVA